MFDKQKGIDTNISLYRLGIYKVQKCDICKVNEQKLEKNKISYLISLKINYHRRKVKTHSKRRERKGRGIAASAQRFKQTGKNIRINASHS